MCLDFVYLTVLYVVNAFVCNEQLFVNYKKRLKIHANAQSKEDTLNSLIVLYNVFYTNVMNS
jgi:hypothetical protein